MLHKIWRAGRFELSLRRPLVMAIVNVTPDSFSDGGAHADPAAALRHARRLLDEGADILDVGGESTRPGAPALSHDQEWSRIGAVLAELVRWKVPVSVDTYHPRTMAAALELGVDIINDICALRRGDAQRIVAASPAGVCLMHMQGEPGTMQAAPHYADVVGEVHAFLLEQARPLLERGVDPARICLDPGFGFGKTREHNLALARELERLAAEPYALLVGVSRKSLLGSARPPEQRLAGSLGAALACVAGGANVVRVHDVAATVDALQAWQAMRGPAAPIHSESQ
jgi:dihydropteroate synthase